MLRVYLLHDYVMRSSMICTAHQILSADQKEKDEIGGTGSTHGRGVNTGFWRGDLRKRGNLEDPSVNGRIILRRIFRKLDGGTWTRLI
jgi:hypothetical protein